MKRLIYLLFFCVTTVTFAQVGIGTQTPDASSMFEVASKTKGFLLPRLTDEQRSSIPSPAQGLIIYNTTLSCVEFYRGTSWFNPCCDKTITRIETDTFYDIHFGYNTDGNLFTFSDFATRTRADSGDVVEAVQNSVDTNIIFQNTLGTIPSSPTPKNQLYYRSIPTTNSFQAQGTLVSELIGGGNAIRSLYLNIPDDNDDFEIFMNARITNTATVQNYGCFFASTEHGFGPSTEGSFQFGVGNGDPGGSGCTRDLYSLNIRLNGESQNGLNCGQSTGNTKTIDDKFHLFSLRNIKRSGAGSDLIWSIDGIVQDTIEGVTNTIGIDAFKVFSNRNESAGMEIEMSEMYFSNDLFTESQREFLVHYYACKNSN